MPFKGIESCLARYQAKAPSIGADLLRYFIPPFAYANGAGNRAGGHQRPQLGQKELGEYIKTHSFDTIVGKIEYALNGEWKNLRVLWVQYQASRATAGRVRDAWGVLARFSTSSL